MYIKK